MNEKYVLLEELEVYKDALELGNEVWKVYSAMNWHDQKIIGDQLITATDSVAANVAEGYGRYHFLDRIKFYYNSRGSLLESKHWLKLLFERKYINEELYNSLSSIVEKIHVKLNIYIKACYQQKNNQNN